MCMCDLSKVDLQRVYKEYTGLQGVYKGIYRFTKSLQRIHRVYKRYTGFIYKGFTKVYQRIQWLCKMNIRLNRVSAITYLIALEN